MGRDWCCRLSLLFHQLLARPAPSLNRKTFISVNFKHCKFFYFMFKSFYTKIYTYNFLECSKKNVLSDLLTNFQVRIFQVCLYIQLLYHKTLLYSQKELSNTLICFLVSLPHPPAAQTSALYLCGTTVPPLASSYVLKNWRKLARSQEASRFKNKGQKQSFNKVFRQKFVMYVIKNRSMLSNRELNIIFHTKLKARCIFFLLAQSSSLQER